MPAPTRTIPPELLKEIATTNFGQIYTNPLYSNVIRWALGVMITFAATNLFGQEVAGAQVTSWVELIVVTVGLVAVIYHRLKSSTAIKSMDQAVADLLPVFESAADDRVQHDLVAALRKVNPTLADAVYKQL